MQMPFLSKQILDKETRAFAFRNVTSRVSNELWYVHPHWEWLHFRIIVAHRDRIAAKIISTFSTACK